VGVFFITQNPRDVPQTVLSQLGHRVQHALRAFTPDDEKALRSAARTYPKTPFYDIEQTLTSLGIGEALVTVLGSTGIPTPPFATRMIPPSARMEPLTDAEMRQHLASSAQVREYAQMIDRESAREILTERAAAAVDAEAQHERAPTAGEVARGERTARPAPGTFEQILKSPVTRSVANTVARGLLGALLGSMGVRRRRVTRRRYF
jgi:hypothetical protein